MTSIDSFQKRKRRIEKVLVMFYKIVHRYVALDLPTEITLFNTITRGHGMKYRTPFCRIDVHKHSFFNRQQCCVFNK